VQYSSPKWGGFSFNLAVVDPWGLVDLSGESLDAGAFSQEGSTYGFEGKAAYAWEGDFSGKVWASFISQKLKTTDPAFDDEDAFGYDVGAKVGFGGFELVGYYYAGEGIGTTDFLFDAVDVAGNTRDSDGMYAQATYKFPNIGTKVGVSWGESNLDRGPADPADTSLVESNESFVIGIYHPMASWLNLVLEYTETEATAHNGNQANEKAIAAGAILSF
jgi:predicted porin